MVSLKWSIQLCIEQYIQYNRLHFVQNSMGLPVTGWTPDAVRTAIKIQSTFQRLLGSCLHSTRFSLFSVTFSLFTLTPHYCYHHTSHPHFSLSLLTIYTFNTTHFTPNNLTLHTHTHSHFTPNNLTSSLPPSQVYTWGCNDEGALGRALGDDGDEFLPQEVARLSGLKVVQVAAGDSHTAALTSTGSLYCWGVFRVSEACFHGISLNVPLCCTC